MSRLTFTSASLIILSTAAQPALSAIANDNIIPPDAERIVVSATRTEQSTSSVLAPASTIEREDIERLQPQTINDLFDKTPGASVTSAGGPGSQSSIFLRGTNNEHTLVLLDGQRISSATLGSTSFQFLDPEQIERIEVVRGPRSSLYGSDAIGGVIQIFTRVPSSKPSAYTSVGYGKYNSSRASIGAGGQFDNLRIGGNLSHYNDEGFSRLDDNRGVNNDDDNYRNSSFNGKIGYDFDNGAKLDLNHFFTQTRNAYDNKNNPQLSPYADSWIQNTGLKLQAPLASFWKATVSLDHAVDDSDNFRESSITSHTHFRTKRKSASWQNDFSLTDFQLFTVGTDYYKELISSSTTYTDSTGAEIKDRYTAGYFGQYLLDLEIFDLQVGARNDHIERVGTETTGNIALGLKLPSRHRIIVSAGTGFRAPTVNDLYWPISTDTYGNPNLKPEKSKNYEIEFRGDYEKFDWSLSAYQNKVKNLIQWAEDPNSAVGAWHPSNVNKAKLRGADFVISGTLDQWLLSGRMSYVDPKDEETDLYLQKRNRRTLGFDVDRYFGNLTIGANWLVHDSRYADAENTRQLGGYGILDVHASYEPTPNWRLALRLNNILDKEYVTQSAPWYDNSFNQHWSDYNTERFGWFATVTYRLQ